MKRWGKAEWGKGLLCAGLIAQGATAVAGDVRTNLMVGVLQVYDDNVLLAYDGAASEPKLSDFITTISPTLELGYETERLDTSITVRQDISRYFEYDELNNVDQTYKGKFSYSLDELSFLNFNAGYERIFSADSDLETSGILLDNTERRRHTYGAQVRRVVSESVMATVAYDYRREDYVGNQYADSEMNNVSLTLHKEVDWLPEAYVYGSGGCLFYRTRTALQRNESMVVGGGFRVSEGISLNLDAGVRKTRDKQDSLALEWLGWPNSYRLVTVTRTEEEWGQVAHAQIKYEGEVTNATLNFGYDVQPSSGQGSLTERTRVQFNMERRLNEDWKVRGFSGYFLNYRDGYNGRYALDKTTVNAGFELSYDINRYLTMSGRYLHTWAQNDEDGTEAERNRVFIHLIGKYDLFE